MIKFLLKGLLRDPNRSLFPLIVVALGVMITVFMQAYVGGVMGESLEKNAAFNTGHLFVETRGYSANKSQMPLDFALIDVNMLKNSLQQQYPQCIWAERIFFSSILDVPDSLGNTLVQGNVNGMAFNLINSNEEINRMELHSLLKKGRFPEKRGETLISDELFTKMCLNINDTITLISTTMYGELSMYNLSVAGTLHFGVNVLDKSMIMVDLNDAQEALNMEDAANQILGFLGNSTYDNRKAGKIVSDFNKRYARQPGQFTPVMSRLSNSNIAGMSYTTINNLSNIIIIVFIFAMSIVLWNTGLISGLRRYGEFGLRLAIGESKGEIYRSLIMETILIGIAGSAAGTALGLFFAWLLQTYGLDITNISKGSNLMISNIIRAKITTATFVIGFIPGLISTVVGALLAGAGIYKRQTAKLFKELEN